MTASSPSIAFATVLVVLGPAYSAAAQDAAPESVVVSASRISLAGYEAPTPVVQIGAEKIVRDAKFDIGDLIRENGTAGRAPDTAREPGPESPHSAPAKKAAKGYGAQDRRALDTLLKDGGGSSR